MDLETIKVTDNGSKFFEEMQRGNFDQLEEAINPLLDIASKDIGKGIRSLKFSVSNWGLAHFGPYCQDNLGANHAKAPIFNYPY